MPIIETWFPEIIYKEKNAIDDLYNHSLKQKCYAIQKKVKTNTSFYCNIYNTHEVFDLKEDKTFTKLINVVTKHVNDFAKVFNSTGKYQYSGGWINISEPGNYQEQHIHPYNYFSAVYYPYVPENSGKIIFKRPYANMAPLKDVKEANQYSFGTCGYEIKSKDLIIFSSHMPHLVEPNSSNDSRISIAMNFN